VNSSHISRQIVRPTGRRLSLALGISAAVLAVLLGLLSNMFTVPSAVLRSETSNDNQLIVRLGNRTLTTGSVLTSVSTDSRSLASDSPPIAQSAAAAPIENAVPATESVAEPAKSKATRDWSLLAKHTTKASTDAQIRQEAARDALWRETHSVMFQPNDSSVRIEEAPLLANVQFIPRVHVLGLGVTVGSCFIGLPFLGVPLDKRATSGITLFVCADEAD
jgi:hypothetical protein